MLSTYLIELLLTFRRRQGPSGEEHLDNELTGVKYIDAHRVRVHKDGTYQNILDLISSPGGVATTVQGGSGINVTETANQQFLIENTAQGQTGAPGADLAFQTITVHNGIG